MYLGYQNDKIKFYTQQRLDETLYNLDRVEETEDEYVLRGDEYVLKSSVINELAEEKRSELVNTLYKIKAERAYGGIIINNALIFETNETSKVNIVASLSLMAQDATVDWKFYTIQGAPHFESITKSQLAALASFGQNMITSCFKVEANYNAQLSQATVENLLDNEWVETFLLNAQADMDEVDNTVEIEFTAQ